MGLLLSDEELDALGGITDMQYRLYISGIRRYMDYETGIVGIKRKISYQSLSEEIYIEPHQGEQDTGTRGRQQIRRAIKSLERKGLVTVKSQGKQLILHCVLAITDKSVQNKADTKPTQQADTQADTEIGSQKNVTKLYKNSNKELRSTLLENHKADTQADTKPTQQADTPPLSVDMKRKIEREFLKLLEDRHFAIPLLLMPKTSAMLKVFAENFTLQEVKESMERSDVRLGAHPKVPWYYLDVMIDEQKEIAKAQQKINLEDIENATNPSPKNITGNHKLDAAFRQLAERRRRKEKEAAETID